MKKALSLSAYYNNKDFIMMKTVANNSFLFAISNTFILTIIERDDGKKKQTLEN